VLGFQIESVHLAGYALLPSFIPFINAVTSRSPSHFYHSYTESSAEMFLSPVSNIEQTLVWSEESSALLYLRSAMLFGIHFVRMNRMEASQDDSLHGNKHS
jgi:hypothetical protein